MIWTLIKVSITIQASLLVFNWHFTLETERKTVKMGKRKLNGPAGEESPVKRKKSSQKFLDSYTELWPCLLPSRKGAHFVHCTVCVSDCSCMQAGRNDCKRHVDSKQHKDYELFDYIKKKLPLNEPVLRHAEVADVALQQSAMSSSLLFFIERLPCLLPKNVTKDRVIEQFAAYQSIDLKTAVGEKVLNYRMHEQ